MTKISADPPDELRRVKEDKFHIYPISTFDEGIALLTGKDAGER